MLIAIGDECIINDKYVLEIEPRSDGCEIVYGDDCQVGYSRRFVKYSILEVAAFIQAAYNKEV